MGCPTQSLPEACLNTNGVLKNVCYETGLLLQRHYGNTQTFLWLNSLKGCKGHIYAYAFGMGCSQAYETPRQVFTNLWPKSITTYAI